MIDILSVLCGSLLTSVLYLRWRMSNLEGRLMSIESKVRHSCAVGRGDRATGANLRSI